MLLRKNIKEILKLLFATEESDWVMRCPKPTIREFLNEKFSINYLKAKHGGGLLCAPWTEIRLYLLYGTHSVDIFGLLSFWQQVRVRWFFRRLNKSLARKSRQENLLQRNQKLLLETGEFLERLGK